MFALFTFPKRTTSLIEPSSGQNSLVLVCQKYDLVIRQFHDGMRACVRLDDKVCSGRFAVEQGPRQRSVLALLLFSILYAAFINVVYARFEANEDTIDALVHLRKNRGVAENNQRRASLGDTLLGHTLR